MSTCLIPNQMMNFVLFLCLVDEWCQGLPLLTKIISIAPNYFHNIWLGIVTKLSNPFNGLLIEQMQPCRYVNMYTLIFLSNERQQNHAFSWRWRYDTILIRTNIQRQKNVGAGEALISRLNFHMGISS